jgi:hypothetical protein
MKFLASMLLAPVAAAQITVATVSPAGVETPVGVLVDVGSTAVTSPLDTRFRLRNTGTGPAVVNTLRVSGTGFSLIGDPTLPYTMAAGTNVDFRVRFDPRAAGSYSATLAINDRSLLVRGSVVAAVVVEYAGGTVIGEGPVDLGRVAALDTDRREFVLNNPAAVGVTVRAIRVTGASFSLAPVALPLELGPGERGGLIVTVSPASPGVHRGTLEVDGRVVRIEAFAPEPPLPEPRIELSRSNILNGEQVSLAVLLAAPAPLASVGTLSVTAEGHEGMPDDQSMRLLPSGGRSVALTFPRGELRARGPDGATNFTLQTGTVAGKLLLKVTSGVRTAETVVNLPVTPVRFEGVTAQRVGSSIEVRFSGMDNTRAAGAVSLAFQGTGGVSLGPASTADGTDAFARYFAGSALGGAFAATARVEVRGDITQVATVEVEVRNPAGTARAARVSIAP